LRIAVQLESLESLEAAVESRCDVIRFGPEFCEYKLPDLAGLKSAHETVSGSGRKFCYITPRLSNSGIEKVREHLDFLNKKDDARIVVNDLGTVNLVRQYPGLHKYLGRQLYRVPARSPWAEKIAKEGLVIGGRNGHIDHLDKGGFLVKRWYNRLFSQTSLYYPPTIELFRSYGFEGVDVDWIPRTFHMFKWLKSRGLECSLHSQQVPIAVTRKCHTARFLGEKSLETCSKPCLNKAYVLKNDVLGIEIQLHGNTVFTLVQQPNIDLGKLDEQGVSELVLTMSPLTRIESKTDIDDFLRHTAFA
jgi:hypothetical protein